MLFIGKVAEWKGMFTWVVDGRYNYLVPLFTALCPACFNCNKIIDVRMSDNINKKQLSELLTKFSQSFQTLYIF